MQRVGPARRVRRGLLPLQVAPAVEQDGAEPGAEAPVLLASQDEEWLRETGARVFRVGPDPGSGLKSQQKNGLTEPCRKT